MRFGYSGPVTLASTNTGYWAVVAAPRTVMSARVGLLALPNVHAVPPGFLKLTAHATSALQTNMSRRE